MSTYQVTESIEIGAPAATVYALLADYKVGHPSILPRRYFSAVEVTKGGQGAGTEFTVELTAFGSKVTYHMQVSEPDPGHILREEDAAAGVVTTFTVDPLDDARSRLTIATTVRASPGIKGWLEKLTTPGVMRRIYREELALIAAAVQPA